MALSCSTQILQRTWRVYFRQGSFCLANVSFRGRGLSSSSSYILRSHSHAPLVSVPLWKAERARVPLLGFRSIRALSSANLDAAHSHANANTNTNAAVDVDVDVPSIPKVTEISSEAIKEEEFAESTTALSRNLQENASFSENDNAEDNGVLSSVSEVEEEVEDASSAVDYLHGISEVEPDTGSANSLLEEEPMISHPWPEWHSFLHMLEAGKHFEFETETTDSRGDKGMDDDAGRIKRASMAFARFRDDIFRYVKILSFNAHAIHSDVDNGNFDDSITGTQLGFIVLVTLNPRHLKTYIYKDTEYISLPLL